MIETTTNSVNGAAGAIQWFRDQLFFFSSQLESVTKPDARYSNGNSETQRQNDTDRQHILLFHRTAMSNNGNIHRRCCRKSRKKSPPFL